MHNNTIHLVECPRDAMQGWKDVIPTRQKIAYINTLLQVGFDTIDFGSFVSPAAIPQMADTPEVINGLDISRTATRLLAIVANVRGAEAACSFDAVSCIGYPFSVSETFQQRNANCSIEASLQRVVAIQDVCTRTSKQLVVYISMAFGNPYGDAYSADLVYSWVNRLADTGITTMSLADTVGLAVAGDVGSITGHLIRLLPQVTIGVHLHATAENQVQKIDAALEAGCRRFDGALKGIGGCPMAGDTLVGNINTERMISHFNDLHLLKPINEAALVQSLHLADRLFTH